MSMTGRANFIGKNNPAILSDLPSLTKDQAASALCPGSEAEEAALSLAVWERAAAISAAIPRKVYVPTLETVEVFTHETRRVNKMLHK
jgi:hypothetical protein